MGNTKRCRLSVAVKNLLQKNLGGTNHGQFMKMTSSDLGCAHFGNRIPRYVKEGRTYFCIYIYGFMCP